jgi:hypothetical protein
MNDGSVWGVSAVEAHVAAKRRARRQSSSAWDRMARLKMWHDGKQLLNCSTATSILYSGRSKR